MARLKVFLNVYGVVSVILFGGLFSLTLIDAPIMQVTKPPCTTGATTGLSADASRFSVHSPLKSGFCM